MKEQVAIRSILQAKLAEIQRQNPNYSLRAFAQKVGVHPGALSYILNGKRNVSRKLGERIAQNLLLDPQQRSELLSLFPEKRKYQKESSQPMEPRYLELNAANFKIAAEWEHFAIMSLLNCSEFKNDPEWIAGRLGISVTKAKVALERLLALGLFQMDEQGKISRSKKSYRTTDDIASISMKKHHEQTLDLAKESLHRDDVQIRDFTTMTVAIDLKKMDQAKEMIRKFHDEFSDLVETGEQTEVYRLGMQFFPLTKKMQ